MSRYTVRKIGTNSFMDEGANFGLPENAYLWDDEQWEREDMDVHIGPDEEKVRVSFLLRSSQSTVLGSSPMNLTRMKDHEHRTDRI